MIKRMLIDASQPEETRMAIVHDEKLIEYESEVLKFKPTRGNIYLAKIIRVEPSLQAAFVDYGAQRHGFLAYNEIHPDYFKIPTSDKEKILAQEHENSSNYEIDEGEDEFQANETNEIEKTRANKKGFLDRVFEFFNYKPIEDESIIKKEGYKKLKQNRHKNLKNREPSIHKKYSIQEVIKRNQVILIQVVKEERGNKGAAVTTRLSLAGRYCVLMPNTNKGGGISRKIFDINLRKKLKEILSSLSIKKGMGVIIRTAGQSMKKTDISRDYKALLKLWNQITTRTVQSTAPSLIHEEGDLLKRSIRDYFSSDLKQVIINEKNTFKIAKDIMKFFMPGFTKFVTLENDKNKTSLFASSKIENQINMMHKPTVKLKSGGYLVINQTEALVAIDINSGKYTKQRNIEDTALRTNLEAAEEIALQMKLRDLAGLIVIDFIDMLERSNNFKVERKMKESIKSDRARIQCGRISNFGLLEMSRQRLKQVINSANSHKCNLCNGNGIVTSVDFTAMQILRVCEEISIDSNYKQLFILVNKEVSELIKNEKKLYFSSLIKRCNVDVKIQEIYDFSISDSLIFHEKEIIYNNCDDEKKLINAINFVENTLSNKKFPKIDEKSNFNARKEITEKKVEQLNKEKNLPKKNKYSKKISRNVSQKVSSNDFQNEVNDMNELKKMKSEKKSRSSYRAKADEFNKENKNGKVVLDKKKKVTRKKAIKQKNNVGEIIQKKEQNLVINDEKKQGWWDQ